MAAIEMLPRVVGRFAVLSTSLALLASCSEWQTDPDGFTEQERGLILKMRAVSPAPPPTALSRLGQALFFDPEVSGPLGRAQPSQLISLGAAGAPGRIACADCHAPTGFYDDIRSTPNNVSLGIDFTSRNSPSLVNVGLYNHFAWDGRSDSLWMQCGVAYESKAATGGSRLRLARRIAAKYAAEYEEFYADAGFWRLARDGGEETEFDLPDGGPPLPGSPAATYLNAVARNSYKALAAYVGQLVSLDAGIDAYAAGDPSALSPAQKRGLRLFLGRAGCVECHQGANFNDNSFHSVGIAQRGEHVPVSDLGRYDGLLYLAASPFNRCKSGSACTIDAPTESDRGQFRTKSLRNAARTPPYMHAGQLQTLEEVVHFYNAGGDTTGFAGVKSPKIVPLGLSEAELVDLVAFLNALSGTAVDPLLGCDPSTDPDDAGTHRFRPCPGVVR